MPIFLPEPFRAYDSKIPERRNQPGGMQVRGIGNSPFRQNAEYVRLELT